MNRGGCESQRNTAAGQKQYPDEAVGTGSICKTTEGGTNKQTKPGTQEALPMNDEFEPYGRMYQDAWNHISIFSNKSVICLYQSMNLLFHIIIIYNLLLYYHNLYFINSLYINSSNTNESLHSFCLYFNILI